MVVIVRHITRVAVLHFARRVRIRVPDRLALAVLVPSALDLVGRGRSAPVEALRKLERPGARRLRLALAAVRGDLGAPESWQRRDSECRGTRDLEEVPTLDRGRHGLASEWGNATPDPTERMTRHAHRTYSHAKRR